MAPMGHTLSSRDVMLPAASPRVRLCVACGLFNKRVPWAHSASLRHTVTGDFSPEGLEDDTNNLTAAQLLELARWASFYREHRKYRKVRLPSLMLCSHTNAHRDDGGRWASWLGGSMTTGGNKPKS